MKGPLDLGLFRSMFLPMLVGAALAALGVDSGLGAEGGTTSTAPSATSEAARSMPSQSPTSSQSGNLPPPPAVASSPSTGNAPTILEWMNQTVRLRDTVEALDRPSSDGKAAGRIRAGAEIKAIGIIAGREWVQIELPDQRLAYIPSAAVELPDSTTARHTGPESAVATAPGATSPEATEAPAVVRGPATKVPNAATLVVADQRIRLLGIDPGPVTALAPQTGRYRCFTASGVDVAEAAILNGAGRVGDGATPGYREREAEARQGHRGLWQGL